MLHLSNHSRQAAYPLAALIVAMVSIQYGASFAKTMFPTAGAAGTAALRLGAAALMLTAVMRPWRARPTRKQMPALLGYGATLGVMNLLFYESLKTIPLGIAVACEFTGPLLVAVISSRRRIDFLWVGLAVAGLFLLSPPLHSGRALDAGGVAFGLGAGACWALYIVFGQSAGAALGRHTTCIGTLIAAAIVMPIGLLQAGATMFTPAMLAGATVIGFFSSALPYSLEMVALTRMPARVYGTLTSLEPALGAFMGFVVLHERLSLAQCTGIGCVAAAALGASLTYEK